MVLEARPALCVEEVTTPEALERLRPEWSALWARCPEATPFQSPEWLIPWWKHIGEGELWTLALREEGRLAGLAPLYVYTGGAPPRQVFPVGIATTDYLDALFEPESGRRGAAALFTHLQANRGRWDVLDLQQLRPGSPLLEAPAPRGWSEERDEQEPCPVLTLPHAVEELPRHVPARLLQNLRYYRRRAEKLGELRMESATGANLEELFEALLRLHRARWSSRGLPGVLAEGRVQDAHRESLLGLLAAGVLRLYALRLDERIVACYYGFMDRRGTAKRAYYYLSGFDPALERLSLGTLVIGHAVQEAVREGAVEFDFLRGREAYKYLWGAKDRPTYRRRLRHAG